jgi:hypothetical protein
MVKAEPTNVARAKYRFKKKSKTVFKVLKILKLNLYMDNVEIYRCANFNSKYLTGYAKIIKSDTCNSEQYIFKTLIFQILLFLWSLEYKVFKN